MLSFGAGAYELQFVDDLAQELAIKLLETNADWDSENVVNNAAFQTVARFYAGPFDKRKGPGRRYRQPGEVLTDVDKLAPDGDG